MVQFSCECGQQLRARDEDVGKSVKCPSCDNLHHFQELEGKGNNKKISLTLLIHPEWLAGSPSRDPNGLEYGGTAADDAARTEACSTSDRRKSPSSAEHHSSTSHCQQGSS